MEDSASSSIGCAMTVSGDPTSCIQGASSNTTTETARDGPKSFRTNKQDSARTLFAANTARSCGIVTREDRVVAASSALSTTHRETSPFCEKRHFRERNALASCQTGDFIGVKGGLAPCPAIASVSLSSRKATCADPIRFRLQRSGSEPPGGIDCPRPMICLEPAGGRKGRSTGSEK
jgi:hypothetical protein